MPKVLDEDQLRRKKALEEKREARRRAKAEQKAAAAKAEPDDVGDDKSSKEGASGAQPDTARREGGSFTDLPEDAIRLIFTMLTAADLGRLAGTCKALVQLLSSARTHIIRARCKRDDTTHTGRVRKLDLCSEESDAQLLLNDIYGGGDTGRISRGKFAKVDFISYARYLQEATTGINYLSTGAREPIYLPRFVQGRFVSVSPEHTLCRVGGDGKQTGAGGSGLASFGVGRRGQLGHGKRRDERIPKRLVGGFGYGIRIVQVSAGGGLVRVATSLFLTVAGRVLSCGTGQYGALGHGFSAAKQLPDVLRPQYIEALNGIRCVCVAAGELHSAAVSSDGDLYTWGDGFCGQCGHGDRRPQLLPKQVTSGGLEDEVVANVTCGARHTVCVTEDGDCWSFGLGHFGVLGRSYTPFDNAPDVAVAGLGDEDNGAVADPPQPPQQVDAGAAPDLGAELLAHLDLIANLTLEDSSDQCIPKIMESLQGTKIVGASAGHRHTLLLDEHGSLYSCGSGLGGCLGHGDTQSQLYPVKIVSFDDERIVQMSAGVDISMAVSFEGSVFAWGKTAGGRNGLGIKASDVTLPRRLNISYSDGRPFKAVDVECGYVHSVIVGLDGTIRMCGGVGVEGEDDGQTSSGELDFDVGSPQENGGQPIPVPDFNIWHRLPEAKEEVAKKEKWKKYGKYEVKGRAKMMSGDES